MSSIFKVLRSEDKAKTKQTINEAIPITGSICSGTYSDENIKNPAHGMWQFVYDYPYLSSSANRIFDLTAGYASDSSLSGSDSSQNAKKINVYNTIANTLVGQDVTGSILKFDQDGNIAAGGTKIKEAYFMCFSRLLVKDGIKKGSFRLNIETEGPGDFGASLTDNFFKTIGDYGAGSSYKVNSPAGDYGIIYTSSATPNTNSGVGLIYYDTGVVVITASLFSGSGGPSSNFYNNGTDSGSVDAILSGSTVEVNSDAIRNRIVNISFNNETEVNSTIYFCRANHNEFNYSSNPTYLTGSKIRVKTKSSDTPITYVTGVLLYSPDNELMAVAKLSEPYRKDFGTPLNLRVRLDY